MPLAVTNAPVAGSSKLSAWNFASLVQPPRITDRPSTGKPGTVVTEPRARSAETKGPPETPDADGRFFSREAAAAFADRAVVDRPGNNVAIVYQYRDSEHGMDLFAVFIEDVPDYRGPFWNDPRSAIKKRVEEHIPEHGDATAIQVSADPINDD